MTRHRQFDPDAALLAAVGAFWANGFEGASLTDLTRAMGISRTSLYATFGDKEALFFQALARYDDLRLGLFDSALNERTARGVVASLLTRSANARTSDLHPPGCMETTSALVVSEAADSVKQALIRLRDRKEMRLGIRLARAQADGDLDPREKPVDLARYVMTVVHGMAVGATSGATRADLLRTVELTLRSFPMTEGSTTAESQRG